VAVVASIAAGLLAGRISWQATLGLLMAFWIVASVATDLWTRIDPHGAGASTLLRKLRQLAPGMAGMMIAHLGVAAFCLGVSMVKSYEVEKDVRVQPGDSTTVRGYTFTFRGIVEVAGPNYDALRGRIEVTRDGRPVTILQPEKRVYRVQQNPMTEAAIDPGVTRDLYVSLGEPVDGGAWILRVYVKPFVDWIWGGCLLMALGGLVAILDPRYRRAKQRAHAPLPAVGASA
jgi:cytochrome c-type biogenesis protein CcmF